MTMVEHILRLSWWEMTLTTDIAVAKAVGIDGILLNTFPYSRQELETSPIKPDRVITDIEDLKTVFT